ncbi:MAG: CRISPR-associated helicase Cas3' [Bacillota bacterium]|nr:CRISPR-associated helicase Cas3' [Bacillota bacterium]
MIVPFAECLARPDPLPGVRCYLSDHLERVACACGDAGGDLTQRLGFLAGLLHDAGKARSSWQEYIRTGRGRTNHAPQGACLFAYAASKLLQTWRLTSAELKLGRRLLLRFARDVYDHHSDLGDLSADVPWEYTVDQASLAECDLAGLFAFVRRHFPEAELDPDEIFAWLEKSPELWATWVKNDRVSLARQLLQAKSQYGEAARLCVRRYTAALIRGDRFEAGQVEGSDLGQEAAREGEKRLVEYCALRAGTTRSAGRAAELVRQRQWVQEQAVKTYLAAPDRQLYSLLLPTGLGKTLTATRLALRACGLGKSRRIIYVAPYLSILSQAAREISTATGLPVLEHHHLALLRAAAEGELPEPEDSLLLESWQAPVVVTTFNQLFRALFPKRAQHTMRLEALDGAFLIIDEPQVISGKCWNAFLAILEAIMGQCGGRALLSTATLPPVEYGLEEELVPLAPQVQSPRRYEVGVLPEVFSEAAVAEAALSLLREVRSAVVILNTVRDAEMVYDLVREQAPGEVALFNLTGCMTPLHKARRIREIDASLASGRKTLVVSTQILECGVDLSFERVLRAVPTVPSIVQAAGRANRHAEGRTGKVLAFRFLREDGADSRPWVYRGAAVREATDACLETHPRWSETETPAVLADYYRELLARDTSTAELQSLLEAASGRWKALEHMTPFEAEYPQWDVFVPYGEEELGEAARSLLRRLVGGGCEVLYERYLDRTFKARLSLLERRQLTALLQHFLVSLDEEVARTLALFPSDVAIGRIVDSGLYSDETGLAHVVAAGRGPDNALVL